ncbi:MAG: pentapeptide repeat-containing protein, partial [Cyanobacteria bacterium P01_A01_bin.135]
ATGLLKFYLAKSQKDLTFEDYVILVCLKAYSESLSEFCRAEDARTDSALRSLSGEISGTALGQTQQRLDALKAFELTESEAQKTLLCFQKSQLSQQLQSVMESRLLKAGVEASAAQRLVERAAWNTHRYITKAWNNLPDDKRRFGGLSIAEWRMEQEKYDSIDTYLKEFVSPDPDEPTRKMRWQVFNEPFTIQELYVPLQAQPLTRSGEEDKDEEPISLEDWAYQLLSASKKQSQVLFIQAGPGRGKSVFCRIFANKIREQLFPIWIPILIRLREIPKLQNSFEDTLRDAISTDFVRADDGWLTDKNTRFLFFLDGFDELLMEGRTSGGLEQFLQQVGRFQERCNSPEMGHRVIVTGRPLALQGVERTLPRNLERVKILPMGDDEQTRWFEQWGKLVNADAQYLSGVLNNQQLPERVRELAREPLLLYLLAAMHRDGQLSLEMFAGAGGVKAKVLIYQKTLDWVLTKQRPDLLNRDLTELETGALYRVLAEAGLCVIQSGDECASIGMIEERLKADDEAKALLDRAQERLKENPLRNALAAFYLQPGRKGEGSVEFAHKSFSEFLCAERIKQAMEDWTYKGRRNKFDVSDEQLHWEIYDLLGTHVLTEEIVEYLFELLQTSETFQPAALFNRLHDFYLRWCNHEFMDEELSDPLPLKKMRKLRKLGLPTKLRSVDVFAGLNVLIILFKLHAAAQHPSYPEVPEGAPTPEISFHPCGEAGTDEFKRGRLLAIIHYADSLGTGVFSRTVGLHLFRANLASARLDGAILTSVNLDRANLNSARLYLTNLYRANLYRANLYRASLYIANLGSANLASADLTSANLEKANLASAKLASAKLASAYLQNVGWNELTDWTDVRGIESATNVPEALKVQLSGEESSKDE